MKNLALLITCFALLSTRVYGQPATTAAKTDKKEDGTHLPESFDTTIIMFGDSSYRLALHYSGLVYFGEYTGDGKNATLTLYKKSGVGKKIIFSDSLNCLDPMIMFHDFNGDGVKDLAIFHSTGARSNPTYYLYLIDPKNKKLIRVNGFEEIPNPSLDTGFNIITGMGLAGSSICYSFYSINAKNKLINLEHAFVDDNTDSLQYERIIKQIQNERKKSQGSNHRN